jgi:hypothetical protein
MAIRLALLKTIFHLINRHNYLISAVLASHAVALVGTVAVAVITLL